MLRPFVNSSTYRGNGRRVTIKAIGQSSHRASAIPVLELSMAIDCTGSHWTLVLERGFVSAILKLLPCAKGDTALRHGVPKPQIYADSDAS